MHLKDYHNYFLIFLDFLCEMLEKYESTTMQLNPS